MTEPAKPALLVLASTYPRWRNDPEPGFVHELSRRLAATFDVAVVGPHAAGAPVDEVMDAVHVHRYRYAPSPLETLVNDGGIVTNLKRQPWKWLLVPGFTLALLWQTARLARQWRPQVIHAHWLIPQGLAVALLSRLGVAMPPMLVTSHGADLFALRSGPLQKLKQFVLRQAAAVTVVSTAMREALESMGVDTARVSVQPMGVDLGGRFTPDTAVERARTEILFVGRLVEKKGLRHLIDAMPRILARHRTAHLTIVGFGPDETALKTQVQTMDLGAHVQFLGAASQADLPGHYRRATLLAAPFIEAADGDQEGLGLVLVEALGCGCPVVTTRIPAVREVFGGDWPEFVATPGSADSLADQIHRLLDDPGAAGAAVAAALPALRERFDWPRVAAGYSRTLLALCQGRGSERGDTRRLP
jgi:glycosyltransferase involved in cell wall biosynthesis